MSRICFTTLNDRIGSGRVTGQKYWPGSISDSASPSLIPLAMWLCAICVRDGTGVDNTLPMFVCSLYTRHFQVRVVFLKSLLN